MPFTADAGRPEGAQLLETSRSLLDDTQEAGRRLKVGKRSPSLARFSIFDGVEQGRIDGLVADALLDESAGRAVGAVVGMAVGDAVGAPLEFLPAGARPPDSDRPRPGWDAETLEYTNEYNKFGLKRGQWTDDCSLGLCVADSLLMSLRYDGSDIRARFWNWWYRGYNNAFRKDGTRSGSVGLGQNVAKSLKEIDSNRPPPTYDAGTQDAGNGSLMRLAPIPVFFHRDPVMAMEWSSHSSYATHPGPLAAAACGFLGYAIARAVGGPLRGEEEAFRTAAMFLELCTQEYLGLQGYTSPPPAWESRQSPRQAMRKLLMAEEQPPHSKERCWEWRNPGGPFIQETLTNRGCSYNGHPVSDRYFGSYSMDALAIALHCVYHTDSFMAAISKCVNLLGDADSTGSITGQLAGAFYGYEQIDRRCIENVNRWDGGQVALRGAMLYSLGGEMYKSHPRTPPPAQVVHGLLAPFLPLLGGWAAKGQQPDWMADGGYVCSLFGF